MNQNALTLIPKIGNIGARTLVSYCGGVEAVFKASKKSLLKIPRIGEKSVKSILDQAYFKRVEEELKFIQKYNIKTYFYLDAEYPARLKECHDSAVLLYAKGNFELNHRQILSIVGTRNVTTYGKKALLQIVEELAELDLVIVSGLAYGVDIFAHRLCVENQMTTLAMLGHGLDKVYPSEHRKTAHKMLQNGGLLTEFHSNARTDKENFPRRNRLIAGISDATLVIETAKKGGSIITALQAHNYNRKVLALPGSVFSQYSSGCNWLIQTQKATLVNSAEDIKKTMGWEKESKKNVQRQLFIELKQDETHIANMFKDKEIRHIDEIHQMSHLNYSTTAAALLSLEVKGIIKSLPGNLLQQIRP